VTTDGARETEADVISSGHEPRPRARRPRARRPAGLVWLLVIAETVVLAGSVVTALHYRTAAGPLQHARSPAASPAVSLMPEVTSVALRLPAAGGVVGTVVLTASALPGARLAQFTVSAVITGGTPDTFYDLIGDDCSGSGPLGNHVWATGFTSAAGSADLVGYAWTGAVTDSYWLTLDPSPVSRPPGVHGRFAAGQATAFPSGQAPCALSS